MHPAKSIVVFTCLSGAGYGLAFLLAAGVLLGLLPPDPWFGAVGLGLAAAMIAGGLLSSLLHLGHPERAWRALSQWRSSWLSREGVASLLSFLPLLALGLTWILGRPSAVAAALTLLAAAGTVFCTAMIYASLKPIRQWHQRLVPALYLLLGLAGGAPLLALLLAAWGAPAWGAALAAMAALGAAWGLKLAYWRAIDGGRPLATPESATGLGFLGQVRLLEPPHSEENYLLREMGYRVARKHRDKLRRIALLAGLALPILCLVAALFPPGWWGIAGAALAMLSGLLGLLVERWLFFAEATHTVTLYYGRS